MDNETNINEQFWQEAEKKHKRGKVFGGILIVVIGSLFLGRELGAEIPQWIFTWKTLLIGFGIVGLLKSNFRSFKWLLVVLIGAAFLICDLYPELAIRPLLWPIVMILFGLIIIFKPHKKNHFHKAKMHHRFHNKHYAYQHCQTEFTQSTNEDRIECTTIMGHIKKNILSKNFKGGEITNVLGGTEIDFTQTDFDGSPTLEITNVLGGTTLILPPNWEIRSEVVSVMGSIEDKRPMRTDIATEKNKILILEGTVIMGGIDIKSFK
jgi:predicted membrane protein